MRISGVSLQKLNKKLKKGSWREKLTNFISRYPSIFALDMFENMTKESVCVGVGWGVGGR